MAGTPATGMMMARPMRKTSRMPPIRLRVMFRTPRSSLRRPPLPIMRQCMTPLMVRGADMRAIMGIMRLNLHSIRNRITDMTRMAMGLCPVHTLPAHLAAVPRCRRPRICPQVGHHRR